MAMPAEWKPPISEQSDLTQVDFGPEREIWRNQVMTGIIHRRVAEVQVITNQRVRLNDRTILLKDLDDIVVMNQYRESRGSSTRYYVRGSNTSFGTGRSSGKSIGDVVFMYQGQNSIVFRQIADPNGVARLAKAARRTMINLVKRHEKIQEKMMKDREKAERRMQKPIESEMTGNDGPSNVANPPTQANIYLGKNYIVCQKCRNNNPKDAKFCGICGISLTPACTKCGHLNPISSSFCNKCGFVLV